MDIVRIGLVKQLKLIDSGGEAPHPFHVKYNQKFFP